jgi:anti-sigma regulatory factor (Ser/Thr protein kinase)
MGTPRRAVSLDGDEKTSRLYERALELVDSASSYLDAAEQHSSRKLAAEFAVERASPGRARRLALSVLSEWGCSPSLLRDAVVVVSELATNAVLHAASSFSLSVALEDSILRIAVHDARPLSVTMHNGGLSPRPTHGLGLVEALSLRWGAEGTAQGKAVWAELRALNELALDESARNESARNESARNESARNESARNESARDEPLHREPVHDGLQASR